MKKFLLIILSLLSSFVALAQYSEEPGNNLGKSLAVMKQGDPELRYIGTDERGDKYGSEDREDGVSILSYFYIKSNQVVEECMSVQTDNGFARMWYEAMVDSFASNPTAKYRSSSYNAYHFCYSTFQVHIIYNASVNSATIIYEQGGYRTGVTDKEFYGKYK